MLLKTFLPAAALCLASSLAIACPGHEGECKDGHCKMKKDVAKSLGLEGARADDAKALQQAQKQERKALYKELKQKKQALKDKHRSEWEGLLSQAELEKLDAMKAHSGHKKYGPKQCKHKSAQH